MQSPFCPNCGLAVRPSARFCGACGHRLEGAPPAAAAPSQKRRRLSPWLVGCGAVGAALLVIAVVALAAIYFWLGLHRSNQVAAVAPASDTVAFASFQPSALQALEWRHVDALQNGRAALAPVLLVPGVSEIGDIIAPLFDDVRVDFQKDVLPWIGREVSLIILTEESAPRPPILGREDYHGPPFVLAASVRDESAAQEFLANVEEQLAPDLAFAADSHRGVAFRTVTTVGQTPLAVTVSENLLLVGSSPVALELALDTRRGGTPTLREKESFDEVLDALPSNRLGFVYFDRDQLAAMYGDELPLLDAIEGAGMALGLHGDNLRWDYVVRTEPRRLSFSQRDWLAAEVEGEQLAGWAPPNSLIYLQGYNLAGLWQMLEGAEQEDIVAEIRYETGVDIDDDLLGQLAGGFAVALGPSGRSTSPPYYDFWDIAQLLMVAETGDGRAVEESLSDIFDYVRQEDGLDIDTTRVNGVEITFLGLEDAPGAGLGYSVRDDLVFLSSSEDALMMAARDEEGLIGDERFSRTDQNFSGDHLVFLYVDVAGIHHYLSRVEPDALEEEYAELGVEAIDSVSLMLDPMTRRGVIAGRVNFALTDREE